MARAGWRGPMARTGWRSTGEGAQGGGGGGGASVLIQKNVGRNRVNAVSELSTKGKIRYFSPEFSREVQDFSLDVPDFFRGKNPAKLTEKSGTITSTARQQASRKRKSYHEYGQSLGREQALFGVGTKKAPFQQHIRDSVGRLGYVLDAPNR